jgi:hypothetical protein
MLTPRLPPGERLVHRSTSPTHRTRESNLHQAVPTRGPIGDSRSHQLKARLLRDRGGDIVSSPVTERQLGAQFAQTAYASKTFVLRSRLFSAFECLHNPGHSPKVSAIPNEPESRCSTHEDKSYATQASFIGHMRAVAAGSGSNGFTG